ncbi:MAG: hypothetical protein JXA28_12265, partial [Bacteroidetes bacterium]|nr:hypothetical protein [Bacteroidota bacterium]
HSAHKTQRNARGTIMNLSTHYYILSLSSEISRLYEGFRDELIDIQNTAFPFYSKTNGASRTGIAHAGSSAPTTGSDLSEKQLFDFLTQTDQHFAQYFAQDPLGLMLVGQSDDLDIFLTLTRHRDVMIGMIRGSFSDTTPYDLGKIVWPVVKGAISRGTGNALRSLAAADILRNVISGIDAVWLSADSHPGSTLYVEDDYHMKTSEPGMHNTHAFANSLPLREIFNDVVDIIIERILRTGGAVVFMDNDSLIGRERIAMLLRT